MSAANEPAGDAIELPRIAADFGFTEEHSLARDAARRFLAERCPPAELRRLAGDSLGYDPGVFKALAELGWIGLVSAAEYGGVALDHLHLALLSDELGRCLLPSPLWGSWLALRALERAGTKPQREKLCPAIIAGEKRASVALFERSGAFEPEQIEGLAEPLEGGFVLEAVKPHVAFGAAAELVIVPLKTRDSGLALFALELPAKGARIDPETSVDPTRRTAKLTLDGVRVSADARLEGDAVSALSAVHQLGVMALAAEMVGGSEAVFEMTRRYACERQQFGRAIGAFQAVKHPIVDMMVGVELARSLTLGAAAALDQDPERAELEGRMAKALSSDVYASVTRKAVQLHGGFGFTWDCDVHFYFKRALACRSLLGDGVHHRRRIARRLFDAA